MESSIRKSDLLGLHRQADMQLSELGRLIDESAPAERILYLINDVKSTLDMLAHTVLADDIDSGFRETLGKMKRSRR